MIVKILETGPLMVNTYVVGDEETRDAVVIDPGGDEDKILVALAKNRLKCTMIFNTHAHFDHIGGNAGLKKATQAEIVIHPEEGKMLSETENSARFFGMKVPPSPPPDRFVKAGDIIKIGNLTGRIVELRGHSPCGVGLVFEKERVVFVGDALFAGSIGRTDFPGGSFELLIGDIRENLFTLPDDAAVYPGHGPPTTIGKEKRFNPFF